MDRTAIDHVCGVLVADQVTGFLPTPVVLEAAPSNERAGSGSESTVLMGYPWSMRPSSFVTIGSHHIVVTEEMRRGRWHRMPGDALCKPRSKFRDLDTHEGEHRRKEGQKFDCLTCLVHNERLGLVSADECGEPRTRSYR